MDSGIQVALQAAGGVAKLARLLDINYQAVYQWKRIPAERLIQIEQVTDIPRDKLRPDLFEGYVRKRK